MTEPRCRRRQFPRPARRLEFGLFSALLMVCSACHTPRPLASPPPRPLAGDLPAFSAPEQPRDARAEAAGFDEPRGDLTLREALSFALLHNPELAAFSWRIRESEALALQASLPPNPVLEGEVEDFGGSGDFNGFDESESTIALSQLVELGGKRARRLRVAEFGSSLTAWDFESRRLMVLTRTTRTFVEVLARQERLELSRRSRELAEQILRSAAERVLAGKSSPLEETRARVVVSKSRIAVERARRDLNAARVRLASAWGSSSPRFDSVVGELETIQPIPALEDIAGWISENPEVARWVVEISERQARVELAKAQAVPDVVVRGGIRLLGGDDDTAFVVGLSLPLPLFDRNQGGVQAARFGEAKAREEQRAAEVRVTTRLFSAYEDLESSHFAATSLQVDVVPAATEAFNSVEEAFSEGKLGYLDVLDAERTLFEVRDEYVQALASYHEAKAEVEGLLGRSLGTLEPQRKEGDQQ